jgi:hypothetical protein
MIADVRDARARGWVESVQITQYQGQLVRVSVDENDQPYMEFVSGGERVPLDSYGEPLTSPPAATESALTRYGVTDEELTDYVELVSWAAAESTGAGIVAGSPAAPYYSAEWQQLETVLNTPLLTGAGAPEDVAQEIQAEVAMATFNGMVANTNQALQQVLDTLDQEADARDQEQINQTQPLIEQAKQAEAEGDDAAARARAKAWAQQKLAEIEKRAQAWADERWRQTRRGAEKLEQQASTGRLTGRKLENANTVMRWGMEQVDDYTFGSGTAAPYVSNLIPKVNAWFSLTNEVVNDPERGGSWGRAGAIRQRFQNPVR